MAPTRRLHPSIPAIAFIIWWVVASVVFPDRMLNADGDMLRHIGHGKWMLQHGQLIHQDPFSFTRGGDALTAFEYGSQLILALVHRVAGLAGVAIFSGLLIATSYALLARFLLSRGVDAFLAYLVSVAAALLGAVHWAARPHLWTLLGVMVVWNWLEDEEDGNGEEGAAEQPSADPSLAALAWEPSREPPIPLSLRSLGSPAAELHMRGVLPYLKVLALFALWANLHGGFLFGLILFGVYFAGSAGEMLLARGEARERWKQRAVRYASFGGAGLVGTLFTPHFLKLHRHIIEFFGPGSKYLLDTTQEFLSPDFHLLSGKLLLLGILGALVVFAVGRVRPDLRRLLLVLVMTYFALDARRNTQLFGATVFPALALQYDHLWRSLPDWRGIRAVFERDAHTGKTWPYALLMVLLFGIIATGHGRVAGITVVPNQLSPREFPVAVVERHRAEADTGRMFHEFIWGGYLIYAWPEQKVFIDGGTDFYGADLVRSFLVISELRPRWRAELARWKIDHALLSTHSSLAHELARDPDWAVVDCDQTAVLLVKRVGTGAAAIPARALDFSRCSSGAAE